MSQDLKLGESSGTAAYDTGPVDTTPKKKSGCSCFLIGCLGLMILIILPIIGAGIYIASMNNAQWGEKLVSFAADPAYSGEIKKGIQNADNMTPGQKEAVIQMYDKFLTDYSSLPQQQKDIIHENIIVLVKKLITNPEGYKDTPPAEFVEILKVLKLEDALLPQTPATTPEVLDSPAKVVPDYDPNADLNPDNVNPANNNTTVQPPAENTTTPTAQPQPDYKTEYDF